MITGLDLVEWQLRVAAGESLPLTQSQLSIKGHAIEARVYAEDPAREFLPSIGKLEYLATPSATDVRIDTGVRQGDEITPYYDPMIAKLIVHAPTRAAACEKLRAALAQFHVAGVRTNLEFLHRMTSAPSFVDARLDTGLIERERAHLLPPAAPPPDPAWELAARATMPPAGATHSPWDLRDGWRLGSRATRPVTLRSSQWERVIELRFDGEAVPGAAGHVVKTRDALHVFHDGAHHAFTVVDPYLPPAGRGDAQGGLTAPMPGRVLAVQVKPGQRVARGAPLMILEAMKMEHTVTAPADGVVAAVLCAEGEQVKEGAELLKLAPP
jgi:3-methylcrotonyl-CoA carboxylase alpha subunit